MKSLRTKTLIYLLSLLLLVGVVTFFAGTRLMDQSLDAYEKNLTSERLARVSQSLELTLTTFRNSATDYGQWDSTFHYMQGTDPEYLAREYFRSNLNNLHIDYVFFLDQDGHQRAFVEGTAEEVVRGETTRPEFAPLLADFETPATRENLIDKQGFLLRLHNDQPYALAFSSVTASEPKADDPKVGWLIMARRLDDKGMSDLRKLTGTHIEVFPSAGHHPQGSETLQFTLQDTLGPTPVAIGLDRPPSLAAQRDMSHKMLAYTLAFMAILAGLLAIVILERLILCRLGLFSQLALDDQKQAVNDIHTVTWPVKGSDELDTLAVSLNQLVSSLGDAQKRMREDQGTLMEAKRQLEYTNRMKDSFLATISHELRTPMNGIIGAEELLKASQPTPYQKECLDTLGDASHLMLSMVERILLFSELQAGNAQSKPQKVALQEWAHLMQRFWTTIFLHCPAKFSMHIGEITTPWVSVDTVKVDQLVQELLRNAAKFTTRGEVSVQLGQVTEGERYWMVVDVRDTGIGIPEDQLQKVMDAFRPSKDRYRRNYGGLGIGLAISRAIVQVLNAEWRIESTDNGTHVHLRIPVEKAEAPEFALEPEAPAPQPAHLPRQGPGRILLVEDNPVNQKIMKKILEMLGWPYQTAENGLEAVEWAQKETFSMILMDCQMPVMDGLEATKVIRHSANPNQFTPIIAITANVSDLDRDNCMSVGMNAYLPKPVKPQQIHDTIHNWMAHGVEKSA